MNQTAWFVVGLVFVALAATYAPKLAGLFVILLAAYLGYRAANKGLV